MSRSKPVSSFLTAAAIVFICTLTTSCDGDVDKRTIVIDNPTDSPLRVEVDGRALTLPAQSDKSVTIKPGTHTFNSPLTGPIEFIAYETRGTTKTLINPTFSTYILVGEVYSINANAAQNFDPTNQSLLLDGVSFSGPFTKKTGLFIDGFWTYDVHQPLPQSITSYSNEKGEIVTKLFAQRPFIDYVETSTNTKGTYDRTKQPANDIAVEYPTYDKMPSISDATVEAATSDLRALHQQYLATTDSKQLADLRKRYFQVSAKLTRDTATLTGSLSDADENAFNTLERTVTDLLSTSMRVIIKP